MQFVNEIIILLALAVMSIEDIIKYKINFLTFLLLVLFSTESLLVLSIFGLIAYNENLFNTKYVAISDLLIIIALIPYIFNFGLFLMLIGVSSLLTHWFLKKKALPLLPFITLSFFFNLLIVVK